MRYRALVTTTLFRAGMEGYAAFRIPSVIALPGGRVLALAEGRKNSLSDSGEIDIVQRISTDGGQTFGPLGIAVSGGGHTAGNPCPVYDPDTGRVILLFNRNHSEGPESLILRGLAVRTAHMTFCDDLGNSWAEEREITAQVKRPGWTWHALGPCHGVRLDSGRLVVPCNHAVLKEGAGESGPYLSHTVFSDDHGETWRLGAEVADKTNECTLAALKNGDVLINMRNWFGQGRRALALSRDGGESFTDFRLEASLPDPCCQGSMLTLRRDAGEIVLFSNASDARNRVRLTLHESGDGGRTWRKACVITPGPAAYSDLAELDGGQLGVLYETGEASPYERIAWTRLAAD